jgi:hypothetical protein
MEVQNQDLVDAGKEAQKKKHQLAGDLGKARVMSGEGGKKVLEEREGTKFDKWWKQPFGIGRIQDDIFTWEITSQRVRSPVKKVIVKPTNPSPNRPNLPSIQPPKEPSISPQNSTIVVSLRSVLCSPTPTYLILKSRRQKKVQVRKKRALEVPISLEKITHRSLRGRLVYHKIKS